MSLFVETVGDSNKEPIVFLHGFTGSTKTWSRVIERLSDTYYCIAIDLTGHGKSPIEYDSKLYAMHIQIEQLHDEITSRTNRPYTIVGYSMGGRIALSYALRYGKEMRHLLLESASPGLRTEAERQERRERDERLAQRIEREGVEAFVRFWEGIPLFETQKRCSEEIRQAVREERLSQSAVGLANSLRGIGTGAQPSYWDALHTLTVSTTCIVGELDSKFVQIAKQMKKEAPDIQIRTVSEAGHAIHVEKEREFATIVKSELNVN